MSEAELEAGKGALYEDLWRRFGANGALASELGKAFAEGRTPAWFGSMRERLAAISAADLQRVAQQYLRPKQAQIGFYGSGRLGYRLAGIGRVREYAVQKETETF